MKTIINILVILLGIVSAYTSFYGINNDGYGYSGYINGLIIMCTFAIAFGCMVFTMIQINDVDN